MFKIYTASDFVYEIEKNISRFKFSLELLINEEDLIAVSKTLLETLSDKEIDIEIIIASGSKDQSMRIFNLINRLTSCGAIVYWKTDAEMLKNQSFFLIYDKVNVINKIFYSTDDSVEDQVRYLNDIFKTIRSSSEEVEFPQGDIKVNFSADKTIINKNELVTISWDVKDASYVSIIPELDEVEHQGSAKIKIKEDTLLQLKAQNKDHVLKKNFFVKVLLSDTDLELDIDVFDPFLNEYISLSPIIENDIERYVAFSDQKIKISWDFSTKKSFKEAKLGDLELKGNHIFKLKKKKIFLFELNTNHEKILKRIEIVGIKDDKISKQAKKIELENKEKNEKDSLLSRVVNFFKELI